MTVSAKRGPVSLQKTLSTDGKGIHKPNRMWHSERRRRETAQKQKLEQ